MGLTTALNSAISGLNATQSQIGLVSLNVANKDAIGYTRRKVSLIEQVSGDRGAGARIDSVERQFDALLQRQLRTETSGAAYTGVKADYAAELDQLFGKPGSAGALDTVINDFTRALQSLVTAPSDQNARAIVLSKGDTLASTLNGLTGDVQSLRTRTEASIADAIRRANQALEAIQEVNSRIISDGQRQTTNPSLLDERDRYIQDLASLIDIRVTEQQNGSISIFTESGQELLGSSRVTLTFDERANVSATSLYTTNPATRGVGTVRIVAPSGASIDVAAGSVFRSGEIAALLDVRDRVLVEAQAQLDDLAAGLSSSLSDRNPTSAITVGANTGFDVNLDDPAAPGTLALQPGNVVSFDLTVAVPAGTTRRISFIAADATTPATLPANATADPTDIEVRLDITGGIAAIRAAVQAAIDAQTAPGAFQVPAAGANVLRVLDNGVLGYGVAGARANVTNTQITDQGLELPLFSDAFAVSGVYTGRFDLNPQKLGFAGRITLNPAVEADSRALVRYSTAGTGTAAGDPDRPQQLLDRLTSTPFTFSPATGIGDTAFAFTGTVSQFARRVVEDQAANSVTAQRLDEGQQVVLNSVQAKFSETAGVNIDQELSDLIQLQNAYAANARIISTVKELLDALLRI